MNDTYFQKYIDRSGSADAVTSLENSKEALFAYLSSLNASDWSYRYAEGKWDVKEMIVHCIDTERIMTFRALSFARGEEKSLPGFDQDRYVEFADASKRNSEDILEEYLAVRMSTLSLYRRFNEKQLGRKGAFSDQSPLSVKAIGKLISGHELSHLDVLRKRYFPV